MDLRLIELGEKIHNALIEARSQQGLGYNKRLGGACAVGSYLLMQEAKYLFNLDLKFTATSGHAWTEFKGHIYDVTATQFDRKEKVYSPKRTALSKDDSNDLCSWYYHSQNRIDLKEINNTWPDYQCPKNYQLIWLFGVKPIITFKKSK